MKIMCAKLVEAPRGPKLWHTFDVPGAETAMQLPSRERELHTRDQLSRDQLPCDQLQLFMKSTAIRSTLMKSTLTKWTHRTYEECITNSTINSSHKTCINLIKPSLVPRYSSRLMFPALKRSALWVWHLQNRKLFTPSRILGRHSLQNEGSFLLGWFWWTEPLMQYRVECALCSKLLAYMLRSLLLKIWQLSWLQELRWFCKNWFHESWSYRPVQDDLTVVDFMRSWYCKSWSRGSWSRESWSRES